jgi:S1-C subfamily serine protease/peroxiredoxin
MFRSLSVAALILALGNAAPLYGDSPADLRDWTIKSGQGETTLTARLSGLSKGTVRFVDKADKEHLVPLDKLPQKKEALSRIVGSGVVVIHPQDVFGQAVGTGSGFAIRHDGMILTNYHVIRGAGAIEVEFRDHAKRMTAECLAVDRACDVAILKVAKFPANVHVLELSAQELPREGEAVWTLGHPEGLKNTVGWGDVNGVRKTAELPPELRALIAAPDDAVWVQTDAVLASGSSGGPLLNTLGQAVGMNTFLLGPQLGFALHLRHAKQPFYDAVAARQPLSLPLPPGKDESGLVWLSREVAPVLKSYREELQSLQSLQTRGAANQQQLVEKLRTIHEKYRIQYLAVAQRDPAGWPAFQALYYVCELAGDGSESGAKSAREACALLAKHHAASPDLASVVATVAGLEDEALQGFCQQVLETSPHKTVQAQAAAALGTSRLRKLALASSLDLAEIQADRAAIEQLAQRMEKQLGDVSLGRFTAGQYGAGLKAELDLVRIGKPAAEIKGVDNDGKVFQLSDYKGKVVVLDFFANWCQWCKKMYPQEQKLVRELKDRPFALLGVNTDPHEVLGELVKNGTVTWRCWADGQGGPIARDWAINGYPNLYLIDHQGIVRRHYAGAPSEEEFAQAIETLLKEAEQAAPKAK